MSPQHQIRRPGYLLNQPHKKRCGPLRTSHSTAPVPPCLNTGQLWFRGQEKQKHGFAVFGQARVTARHVPRNTCGRRKPTLPLHVHQASTHPGTQKHVELQLHQHFYAHIDPSQSHKPHSLMRCNRKNGGSKKKPKSAETRARHAQAGHQWSGCNVRIRLRLRLPHSFHCPLSSLAHPAHSGPLACSSPHLP